VIENQVTSGDSGHQCSVGLSISN